MSNTHSHLAIPCNVDVDGSNRLNINRFDSRCAVPVPRVQLQHELALQKILAPLL